MHQRGNCPCFGYVLPPVPALTQARSAAILCAPILRTASSCWLPPPIQSAQSQGDLQGPSRPREGMGLALMRIWECYATSLCSTSNHPSCYTGVAPSPSPHSNAIAPQPPQPGSSSWPSHSPQEDTPILTKSLLSLKCQPTGEKVELEP